MIGALPWVFVALAAVALLFGFAAFWLSLRGMFTSPEQTALDALSESRRALIAEKDALLQEIQDLAFERESGKLSENDFAQLNAKLRARAKAVLAKLDEDVAPFRKEARQLVAVPTGEQE